MSNLEEKKHFKGTLNDFIKIIKESMYQYYEIRDDKITERLVRYYITKSIIPRPLREGKDVFYLYEHILKFLYARKQIIDGWPMSKFREIMKFEDNEYFENFLNNISQSDKNSDSLSLIQEFKTNIPNSNERNFRSRSNPLRYRKRVDIPKLQDALVEIDADLGNVVKQEFTTLQLASWLVLLIENHKLSGMTYELSRKIGDAISAALIERNPMTSQDLQKEFSQYKENEQLKYNMEKLSRENDYLRHKIEEEKQDKYKSDDLKSKINEKLKNYLGQSHLVQEILGRNISSIYNESLEDFISSLKNLKPEILEKKLPELLESFEMTINHLHQEEDIIVHQKKDEMNKFIGELIQIISELKK